MDIGLIINKLLKISCALVVSTMSIILLCVDSVTFGLLCRQLLTSADMFSTRGMLDVLCTMTLPNTVLVALLVNVRGFWQVCSRLIATMAVSTAVVKYCTSTNEEQQNQHYPNTNATNSNKHLSCSGSFCTISARRLC